MISNTSKVGETEAVSQLEVRTRMGKASSLRQQGQATQAQAQEKRSQEAVKSETELEQLIREQTEDMENGHRVWNHEVPYRDEVSNDTTRSKGFIQPLSAEDSRHGTINGYVNYRCRCSACKQANTDYHRIRNQRLKGIEKQREREEQLGRLAGY